MLGHSPLFSEWQPAAQMASLPLQCRFVHSDPLPYENLLGRFTMEMAGRQDIATVTNLIISVSRECDLA